MQKEQRLEIINQTIFNYQFKMRAINCFKNQKKFDDLNIRVDNYCVDNIENYKADKWCDAIIHPTTSDIAFVVEDRILPALTDTEKSEIIELSADWFPNNNPI